jgi:hypothetical protein
MDASEEYEEEEVDANKIVKNDSGPTFATDKKFSLFEEGIKLKPALLAEIKEEQQQD